MVNKLEKKEKIITDTEFSAIFLKEFPSASYQEYQLALRRFKDGWKIESIFEDIMFRDFDYF